MSAEAVFQGIGIITNAFNTVIGNFCKSKTEERKADVDLSSKIVENYTSTIKDSCGGKNFDITQEDIEFIEKYSKSEALNDLRDVIRNSSELSDENKIEKLQEVARQQNYLNEKGLFALLNLIKTKGLVVAAVLLCIAATPVVAIAVVKHPSSSAAIIGKTGKALRHIV